MKDDGITDYKKVVVVDGVGIGLLRELSVSKPFQVLINGMITEVPKEQIIFIYDYSRELFEALTLSYMLHRYDLYGDKNYFFYHIVNVANRVKSKMTPTMTSLDVQLMYIITAILHDVVEDHNVQLYVIEQSFGYEVKCAVEAISYRKKSESREQYYIRCSANPMAAFVKICDAEENQNNSIIEKDFSRSDYYGKAIKTIEMLSGIDTIDNVKELHLQLTRTINEDIERYIDSYSDEYKEGFMSVLHQVQNKLLDRLAFGKQDRTIRDIHNLISNNREVFSTEHEYGQGGKDASDMINHVLNHTRFIKAVLN